MNIIFRFSTYKTTRRKKDEVKTELIDDAIPVVMEYEMIIKIKKESI